MSLPQNLPEALSNLTNLTDEIWHHAGDTSTDVSLLCTIMILNFSDRQIWAKRADPDQTAPRGAV